MQSLEIAVPKALPKRFRRCRRVFGAYPSRSFKFMKSWTSARSKSQRRCWPKKGNKCFCPRYRYICCVEILRLEITSGLKYPFQKSEKVIDDCRRRVPLLNSRSLFAASFLASRLPLNFPRITDRWIRAILPSGPRTSSRYRRTQFLHLLIIQPFWKRRRAIRVSFCSLVCLPFLASLNSVNKRSLRLLRLLGFKPSENFGLPEPPVFA